MKKRSLSAFTFIELIIAITIFSIIAVSIYSTVRAGIRVWHRANSVIEVNQEMRIFFDMVSSDMKNAVAYYTTTSEGRMNFEGMPSRISFMTLVNVSGQDVALHQELARVAYYFDTSSKSIKRILATKEAGFNETNGITAELVNNIDAVSFNYCYKPLSSEDDYVWKDVWEDGGRIPRGVRIKTGSFEKTIFIPTGELGGER